MKTLTKEQSKRNASLVAEEIDAMGQESETKAVRHVQEVEKNRQQQDSYNTLTLQEDLEKKRRYKKNPYYQSLLNLAKKELSNYDVPKGYQLDVLLKEDGRLIFGLCKIGFRWYAKGMKICGDPKYDINCVERLAVQSMLSLDELYEQHELHQTKDGIQLPVKDKFSL